MGEGRERGTSWDSVETTKRGSTSRRACQLTAAQLVVNAAMAVNWFYMGIDWHQHPIPGVPSNSQAPERTTSSSRTDNYLLPSLSIDSTPSRAETLVLHRYEITEMYE